MKKFDAFAPCLRVPALENLNDARFTVKGPITTNVKSKRGREFEEYKHQQLRHH